MKWNNEELNKAILLVKNGNNYIEIGKILNRSRSSVKNKLEELGIKYKEFNSSLENRNCKTCNSVFEVTKSSEKIFCNHSCSASFNNKQRKKEKFLICPCCEKQFKKTFSKQIYCSPSCSSLIKRKDLFKSIELGNAKLPQRNYKNYLIHKHGEKCMDCGWNKTNPYSNKIPIELEHIDGNSENNELSNLKLLCPNCHSLTPTYKYLNVGMGRHSRRQRYKEGKSF